jgi:ribose transport system ATP-binding protein
MHILEFSGLTKRYGAATVLNDVSITLQPGRVHALMGENGAGKSTLIKLLAGVVAADRMIVRKDDTDVLLRNPADAARAGFRVIHQELNLVPQLSVAENILLGRAMPQRFGLFIDWRALALRAREALAQLDIHGLDVTAQAGALSPGDRMLVKIASALVAAPSQTPCLYVLDEPTAALSQTESERLFNAIRKLKQSAAILYVSHRLAEVMTICDDVTVLRNGAQVYSAPIAQTSRDEIILHMTGRALTDSFPPRTTKTGAVVAQAANLASRGLSDLNFTLHQGEIMGVAGLAGSGQSEVLNLFMGLERPERGSLTLLNQPAPATPAEAWSRAVAFVPPERRSQGLALRMGARSNALSPHYRGIWANLAQETTRTAMLATRVNLKAANLEQSVWQLSGGNQQKVLFARAMAATPRLLLLDEPTRGVDIAARAEIYRLIRTLSAQGCAVLMASSDLTELMGLCDRIIVLQAGRQVQILTPHGLGPNDLLQACYATEHVLT